MYKHPSTQANIKTLKEYGNFFIEPQSGFLASGLEGKGRMEEPETIVEYMERFFVDSQPLKGKKVMITAGPTYEKIDPVRFIGNYSSGKMGFALAEECAMRGSDVTLIAGPVSQKLPSALPFGSITRIDVESCEEMYNAALKAFDNVDAAILCAAVADFRPSLTAETKIKRKGANLSLTLLPTHDIAAALGKKKKEHQVMVGFALETDHEEENAMGKLNKKNLDCIVMNSLRNEGTCFKADDNQVTIITDKGMTPYPKKTKSQVAEDIIDVMTSIINDKQQ